ncbi:replication stress response regulator SDE2-like [Aplysia californica]|uniref:Replication stress response regulator SDE2-like n=1 Tax=Aplysia californica TaxID=6500 RepID=A0ABM1VVJ3_APLCA|nr:replication stress response regulator SDE2-like [Aplysia californica]
MDIDSDDLDSESDTEARPGSPSLDNGASTSKVAPVEVKSEPGENSSAASRVSSSTSEHGDPASLQQSPVLGSDHIAGSSDSNSPPPVAEVKTEPDGGDGGSEDKPHPHSLLSQLPPPSSSPNVADRKPGDLASPATVADPAETVDPNTPVDLELYASEKELAALGLERLKCALMSRGIKCGGTLEERAARLFSVRGLSTEEIDPWLFAKSKGKGKKSK